MCNLVTHTVCELDSSVVLELLSVFFFVSSSRSVMEIIIVFKGFCKQVSSQDTSMFLITLHPKYDSDSERVAHNCWLGECIQAKFPN